MNVYIFGNSDLEDDSLAFQVSEKLQDKINNVNFISVKPNEDLPFSSREDVVILDTVLGIEKVEVICDEDLDKIILSPRLTAHDFDLGFQLRYLKKLGKLGKVTIVGLPMKKDLDYFLIQSILRKLVAQDIQGS